MNDWITLLHTFKTSKTPVALVTVTQVLGSAPCKIGSKMIVTHQKEIFGTIGGGKLEFHIITQAQKAIESIAGFIKEKFPMLGGAVDQIFAAGNKNDD